MLSRDNNDISGKKKRFPFVDYVIPAVTFLFKIYVLSLFQFTNTLAV